MYKLVFAPPVTIHSVPEGEAHEENFITKFSEIEAEDIRLQVKKLTPEARISATESRQGVH